MPRCVAWACAAPFILPGEPRTHAAHGELLPTAWGFLGTSASPELVAGAGGSQREADRFSFPSKQHPACVRRAAPPLRPAATRHVSEACAPAAFRPLLGAVVTRLPPGSPERRKESSREQTRGRAWQGSSSGEWRRRKPSPECSGLGRRACARQPVSWRGMGTGPGPVRGPQLPCPPLRSLPGVRAPPEAGTQEGGVAPWPVLVDVPGPPVGPPVLVLLCPNPDARGLGDGNSRSCPAPPPRLPQEVGRRWPMAGLGTLKAVTVQCWGSSWMASVTEQRLLSGTAPREPFFPATEL